MYQMRKAWSLLVQWHQRLLKHGGAQTGDSVRRVALTPPTTQHLLHFQVSIQRAARFWRRKFWLKWAAAAAKYYFGVMLPKLRLNRLAIRFAWCRWIQQRISHRSLWGITGKALQNRAISQWIRSFWRTWCRAGAAFYYQVVLPRNRMRMIRLALGFHHWIKMKPLCRNEITV